MKNKILLSFFLLIFSFASYAYEPFSGALSPFEKSTPTTANEIMGINNQIQTPKRHYRNDPNNRGVPVGNWLFEKKNQNPRRWSGIFPSTEDQSWYGKSHHNHDTYQNDMGSYYGLQKCEKDHGNKPEHDGGN